MQLGRNAREVLLRQTGIIGRPEIIRPPEVIRPLRQTITLATRIDLTLYHAVRERHQHVELVLGRRVTFFGEEDLRVLRHDLPHVNLGGFALMGGINSLSNDLWKLIRGERTTTTIDVSKLYLLRAISSNVLNLLFFKQRAISDLVKSIFTPVEFLHDSLRPIRSVA